MESLLQDLRYALRALRKTPGFTAVALLTLALGIGATTAIFSVANGVLLTPLPYPAPDRLMMVWERNRARGGTDRNVVSPANYLDWKNRAKSFSELALFTWSDLTFTGDSPEHVSGRLVTPNLFTVLGVSPMLGRVFTPVEVTPGAPRLLVLSHPLWRSHFAGDSSIIGRTVPIAGGTATVIGVMPPSFRSLPWGNDQYWEAFVLGADAQVRRGRYTMVVGRLRDGASQAQAQNEMATIASGMEREYPAFNTGWGVSIVSLTDQVVGSSRPILMVLLGAVSLLLLITCANVGNLMLSRATSRQRELTVRSALGASRSRLIGQWLVESSVLGLLGGGAGAALAALGVDALIAARPADIPRIEDIGIDPRVLLATAAISIAAALAFGLPAVFAGMLGGREGTLAGSRTTAGSERTRFRAALVIGQVSLALVLLFGAGLLVRSIQRLTSVDPGFDSPNLVTVSLDLPQARYPDPERRLAFIDQLQSRIRQLPGVAAAGVVDFLPLAGPGAATTFTVPGQPAPRPGEAPVADIRVADADYFRAMRIPLLAGRLPGPADGAKAPVIVLVNQALARASWPGQDPVGRRIKVEMLRADDELEVVGVVGDVRGHGLDEDIKSTIYYAVSQVTPGSMTLVIRDSADGARLEPALRGTIREIDRELPMGAVSTMEAWLARSMSQRRYPMMLLAVFAALALGLAGVGVYGVLSYAVAQRTREIGVRMALGARPHDVFGMLLSGGLKLILAGVVLGALAGMFAARVLQRLLFGITPADPVTLIAVTSLLVVFALVAMYLPARRATRVDPAVALRGE